MYKTINEVTIGSLKKNATMIHYFGLGFIQIKLGDKYRIHIYTKELPAIVGDEEIHNHRYDFTSTILYGNYIQNLFVLNKGNDYIIEDESCSEEKMVEHKVPNYCSIKKISEEQYTAGSSYKISHETFHTTDTVEAITLLERTPYAKEFAQVVRPKNSPKICPFSQKIDEEVLWDIVEKFLEKVKSTCS